jgi:hypothetical protein
MPTRDQWGEAPGLRISYDVAESENEIVKRAIAASSTANAGVVDSALLVLQSELQAAMVDLESQLEQGVLSLSDYAQQLQVRIAADKRSAVAHKKAGDVQMAMRLLRHTKLMQHELDELKKELPPPAPATGAGPGSATPAAGEGQQKKEFKSDAARAVQALMTQFNTNLATMDRTTLSQQAELEAELDGLWAQQHGGQRPPKG